MSLYQARGRIITAFNVQEWNMDAVAEWCDGSILNDGDDSYIEVETVMGKMDALVGDIIARDSDGATFVLDSERFTEAFVMVA